MSEPSCDEIEFEILRLVTEKWRNEPVTSSIGEIYLGLKKALGEFPQLELQEGLIRLHAANFILLDKQVTNGSFTQYEGWREDLFFHQGGFRIHRTQKTKPRMEEIEKLVASEPVCKESPIPSRLQRVRFRTWEQLGLTIIEGELKNGGVTHIGGTADVRQLAAWWVKNKRAQINNRPFELANHTVLIGEARIRELEESKSPFDLKKLVQIATEIDIAFANGCYISIPLLMRVAIDHVPPLFGQPNFANVVAQHATGKTLKETLARLNTSTRDYANGIIHEPISKKAILPSKEEVCGLAIDFNALLKEIIKHLS